MVPAQLPPRAAGPELVDARGLGVLRRHPALLVRPRHRRLPHRRRARDRERQGAARRSRPTPTPPWRAQARVQHEPARDARGLPPLAPDLRGVRPAAAAHRRDPRPRPGRHGLVLRTRRRAPARLQLRVRLRAVRGRAAPRASSSRPRRPSPRVAGRSGRCRTTTSIRFPTRWANGDPDRTRCALLVVLAAARDSGPATTATRSGWSSRRSPASASSTSPATATAPARRCAGRRSAGHGFTGAGVEPWLPFGSRAGRRVPAGRPGFDAVALPRPAPAATRAGGAPRRPYASLPSPDGVWAWRRGPTLAAAMNLGSGPADCRGRRRPHPRRHRPRAGRGAAVRWPAAPPRRGRAGLARAGVGDARVWVCFAALGGCADEVGGRPATARSDGAGPRAPRFGGQVTVCHLSPARLAFALRARRSGRGRRPLHGAGRGWRGGRACSRGAEPAARWPSTVRRPAEALRLKQRHEESQPAVDDGVEEGGVARRIT